MSELQSYAVVDVAIGTPEPPGLSAGVRMYVADEVDARLALMQRQMTEMREMYAVSIADAAADGQLNNATAGLRAAMKALSHTGLRLSLNDQTIVDAALANDAAPHPDTARLDKLPQCFHMLRTCPGTKAGGSWWYSYETNREYATLREAIDAHIQPGEQP